MLDETAGMLSVDLHPLPDTSNLAAIRKLCTQFNESESALPRERRIGKQASTNENETRVWSVQTRVIENRIKEYH